MFIDAPLLVAVLGSTRAPTAAIVPSGPRAEESRTDVACGSHLTSRRSNRTTMGCSVPWSQQGSQSWFSQVVQPGLDDLIRVQIAWPITVSELIASQGVRESDVLHGSQLVL